MKRRRTRLRRAVAGRAGPVNQAAGPRLRRPARTWHWFGPIANPCFHGGRLLRRTILLPALFLVVSTVAAAAQTPSCDRAWEERNAIYKDAGYCFKTPKAIAAFGNRGCRY